MDGKLDGSIYTLNINLLAVIYSLILQSNMAMSCALINEFEYSRYTMMKVCFPWYSFARRQRYYPSLNSKSHSQL